MTGPTRDWRRVGAVAAALACIGGVTTTTTRRSVADARAKYYDKTAVAKFKKSHFNWFVCLFWWRPWRCYQAFDVRNDDMFATQQSWWALAYLSIISFGCTDERQNASWCVILFIYIVYNFFFIISLNIKQF